MARRLFSLRSSGAFMGSNRFSASHRPTTSPPYQRIGVMRRIQKPSPTESPLLFELDPEPLQETLTVLGGIPLVVQAFPSVRLPSSVQQHVAVKERERGYDEATFVESFVILNAAGGECVDDF